MARRLDELYQGKTYADVERDPRHPQLVIAATDMSLGTPFEFTSDQFELICSDLRSVPLSFAVAASSAVPILLSPMTLKNYAGECRERGIVPRLALREGSNYRARMFRMQANSYLDAQSRPYIHLVDGGVADNLAVRRLLDRALSAGGLRESFEEVGIPRGSVRNLVLISVNSARDPANNIDQSDRVPGVRGVADTLLFGAGARATTETQEFLLDTARQWREDLRTRSAEGSDAFAADAEIHVVQVNLRECRRRRIARPAAAGADRVLDQRRGSDPVDRGGPQRLAPARRTSRNCCARCTRPSTTCRRPEHRPRGGSGVLAHHRPGGGRQRQGHRLGAARPHARDQLVGVVGDVRMVAAASGRGDEVHQGCELRSVRIGMWLHGGYRRRRVCASR